MKRGIFSSYIYGIKDAAHGESYTNILRYFFPELVSAIVLYSFVLIDETFIAKLNSTSTYATLGVTGLFMHFLTKIAEGWAVGSFILSGHQNGAGEYKKVGQTVVETFWITLIVGAIISGSIYFGAYWIFNNFYDVPTKMITLGVPFLRLRVIGIFFMFLYLALISFFRSIKDTKTPMNIFLLGGLIFVLFDYLLIFGKFGFPQMGLNGSAVASIIQYAVMFLIAMYLVFFRKENRKYSINIFSGISSFESVKKLILLSWPVVLDKAVMASSYVWLGKMLAPMGKCVLASFTVVKTMERTSFLPAVAFAQIITILASNDFGASLYENIKTNIKKVLFMASLFVFILLFIFFLDPKMFIHIFDKKNAFTDFSAKVFPILSIFIVFDVLQIILSGALRGIGDVRVVMWTRVFVTIGFFFPLSYLITCLPIQDEAVKFILIYGMFYIGSALMSFIYVNRFRSNTWKQSKDN